MVPPLLVKLALEGTEIVGAIMASVPLLTLEELFSVKVPVAVICVCPGDALVWLNVPVLLSVKLLPWINNVGDALAGAELRNVPLRLRVPLLPTLILVLPVFATVKPMPATLLTEVLIVVVAEFKLTVGFEPLLAMNNNCPFGVTVIDPDVLANVPEKPPGACIVNAPVLLTNKFPATVSEELELAEGENSRLIVESDAEPPVTFKAAPSSRARENADPDANAVCPLEPVVKVPLPFNIKRAEFAVTVMLLLPPVAEIVPLLNR
jgi:hypothetical protein